LSAVFVFLTCFACFSCDTMYSNSASFLIVHISCFNSCISALRGLSCDADIRHLIVRRGGLRPLLAVIKRASDRDFKARHPPPPSHETHLEQQQQVVKENKKGKGAHHHHGVKEHHWEVPLAVETIGALLNLSLSGCIGENPNRFLQACSANTLAEFLCSPDRIYRLFGATALGNVAAAPRLQSKVIAAGALELLIEVANNSDLETQRCAAYALSNLATDYSRRAKIVVGGGLPSIVSLACSESASDAKAASATLRGLAASPLTRRPLVEAGVLDAFSQAAQVLYMYYVGRTIHFQKYIWLRILVYNTSLSFVLFPYSPLHVPFMTHTPHRWKTTSKWFARLPPVSPP